MCRFFVALPWPLQITNGPDDPPPGYRARFVTFLPEPVAHADSLEHGVTAVVPDHDGGAAVQVEI